MTWVAAPLKSSFMIMALFGFFISVFLVDDMLGISWSIAFGVVFLLMIISSIVSMTHQPIQDYDIEHHRKKKE